MLITLAILQHNVNVIIIEKQKTLKTKDNNKKLHNSVNLN